MKFKTLSYGFSAYAFVIIIALGIFFGELLTVIFIAPNPKADESSFVDGCQPLITTAMDWLDQIGGNHTRAAEKANLYIKLYQLCAFGNQPMLERYIMKRYVDTHYPWEVKGESLWEEIPGYKEQ